MKATPRGRARRGRALWLPWIPAVAALATLGCHRTPFQETPWLVDADGAAWIVYPAPADTRAHPVVEIEGVFRRSFDLAGPSPSARLRLRAFRAATVTLNGQRAPFPSMAAVWPGEAEGEVGPFLRAGANELSIVVANRSGPPALWAVLELPGRRVLTGEDWEASRAGAAWRPAARAADHRKGSRFDPDGRAERVSSSLLALWPWLLVLSAVAFAAATGIDRWIGTRDGADRPRSPAMWILPLIPGVLLATLLLNNSVRLPRGAGFDAEGHLDYVRHVQEQGSLPLADQGWQMYQPPLYYLLASLLLRAGSWSVREAAGVGAIRLLNLALALCNLVLLGSSLRLVFPENGRRRAIGLLVAAFLPALLIIAHYPTNEVLVITLSSAVFWAFLRLLRAPRPRLRDHAAAGAALGAALLAKFSPLMIVPGLLAALLLKLRDTPPVDRRRQAGGIVVLVGAALLVCGWHYARVAARFGHPLLGNWDRKSGFAWWQDPGYRTPGDYLRFGQALDAPLFSGIAGVWDGFYSTLWGDGLCSGVIDLVPRPPWAYSLMAAGFLLALVPTIGLMLGTTLACVRLFRRPDVVTAVLAISALSTCAGLVLMTLRVPSYAQAKAFYGLVALVPFAALAACGIDRLAGSGRFRRRLVFASLGLWAMVSYASYWVPGSAARTRVALGAGFITDGDPRSAAQAFQSALAEDPESWDARLALANLLLPGGAPRGVLENLLLPSSPDPPFARRHLTLSLLLLREGETAGALQEADRGLKLNPDLVELHLLRGALLEAGGDQAGAVSARREALRIDPFDAANHLALGRLLALIGDPAGAEAHHEYARRLGGSR